MLAIVHTDYGPPAALRCEDIEKPRPADDQVLIKVRAASVNAPEWRLVRGRPRVIRLFTGLRRPKRRVWGSDVAGTVEAVGRNVTAFKPGDDVFGVCRGAFAEYACASEPALVTKPPNVTFEQAASVPVAGLTALQGLRNIGRIQSGHRVLINGAGGGIGTFAVQIGKVLGARVTGVCSARNASLVRSLGADRVIDYAVEDFTRDDTRYDVILDIVGNRSLAECRRVLAARGVIAMAGGPKEVRRILARAVQGIALSWTGTQKFRTYVARVRQEDLAHLRDLLAMGKMTSAIDRRYPLREAPAAIAYLEQGHTSGKVVIAVS